MKVLDRAKYMVNPKDILIVFLFLQMKKSTSCHWASLAENSLSEDCRVQRPGDFQSMDELT